MLCSQYPALLVESESLLTAVNKCTDRSNASARLYIQQLNNEYNEIRCDLFLLVYFALLILQYFIPCMYFCGIWEVIQHYLLLYDHCVHHIKTICFMSLMI